VKTRFDKYELIERIGKGGMAEVYLAKSHGAEGLEKQIVIKRVLPELSSNARFVEMFIAEAKIAMGLNHPNIVQIYDFGRVEDDFYLAMEYVEGWDLGQLLGASARRGEPWSLGEALVVALDVAKGLDYAHRRTDGWGERLGLVHCDISPQNILVSREGTAKIVDFGIARAASEEEQQGVVKGKYSYMSPEQASGKPLDARSDLFSLGVVLFELVCGRMLFKQGSAEETLSLVKSGVVPDIASLRADVPPGLERLLYRTLARDPGERPQTARELQQELMRELMGLGGLHDAYTVAEQVSALEPWLTVRPGMGGAQVSSAPEAAGVAEGAPRTSVIRTAPIRTTGPARTEVAGLVTPVTPALQTPLVGTNAPSVVFQARERKEVVLLAGELQGLLGLRAKIGQDRWLQVFQEYTRMVDSIAFKSDGVVHRVGETSFLLLLGVPISSENDAERGARMAMDLQDAMAGINLSLDQPLQLAIGLAIGEVLLEQEVEAGQRRYSWSFFGSSHEFVERLARAGLGKEILIGGQVWRRVRRDFDCEEIDPVRLPAEGTAQAWRLVGPRSQRDRVQDVRRAYHAFYGRELALKALRGAYREAVMEGSARALVITGEQGVGKSTLLEEFARGLDPRNVRVLRGVASPFDREVPLGGMGALLAELLRLGSPDDLRQVRATLETRIQALFPEVEESERELLLHSIGGIFSIRFPGSAFEELGGEERRRRISKSVRDLFKRFADRKPLVLAIDDAQYIDSMTLEITTQLFDSRQDSPMLLLLLWAGASDRLDTRWRGLLSARYVSEERLGELGQQEARQMVRDLLRVHRVEDPQVLDAILRHTGGNPFFIKEVVEVLRDRDMLQDATLKRHLALELDQADWLPTSVEGAIASRVDRLPLEMKVTLQRVALLWSPFEALEAAHVLEGVTPEALEELVARGFLEHVHEHVGPREASADAAPPTSEGPYRFSNAIAQEVVSRGLPPEESQRLHQRIADYLVEGGARGQGVTEHARLARHHDAAGNHGAAIHHYWEAAQAAFEQYGAVESLSLCDRILDRVDEADERGFKALLLKEQALGRLGLASEHLLVLERLTAHVASAPPAERAEVMLRRARHHYEQGEHGAARQLVEGVLALVAGDASLGLFLARATHMAAYLEMERGRHDEALRLVREAIGFYSAQSGSEAVQGLVSAHNVLGVIYRRAGQHEEALRAYDAGLALLAGHPAASQLGRYVMMNRGLALVYLARPEEALPSYRKVVAQAQRMGHRRDEAGALVNLGHALQVLGDLDAAASHVQRGLYLARKVNASVVLADGEVTMGVIYAERGDKASAERLLAEGLRLAESIPHVYLAVSGLLALARLRLEGASAEDARIVALQAEDCVERAQQAHMPAMVACARATWARALGIMGRMEQAQVLMAQAMEDADIIEREQILWDFVQLGGDAEAGEAALEEARALVRRRACWIEDVALRARFLDRPLHRAILGAEETPRTV
jgi:eukaryotic-like serine/threonine-protein kinase